MKNESPIESIGYEVARGLEREGSEYNIEDIQEIETAKGSTYRYLPDGTTQRYKKAEGKEFNPQSMLVFIPDFDFIRAKKEWVSLVIRFQNDPVAYEQAILEAIQGDGDAYIIDYGLEKPKILQTNDEVRMGKKVSLTCFYKDGTPQLRIPISPKPLVGFITYDERRYAAEDGTPLRENHVGNSVTKIILKDK